MIPSLLSRLASRLSKGGQRMFPRNFLKGKFQAYVVSASSRHRHGFRPRLEVLEERLAPAVSFAPQATFALGVNNSPFAEAVGDFNGDGKPDLAVLSSFSGSSMRVLLNTTVNGAAAPTFAAPQTVAIDTTANDVAVGDINGDGLPDLVVSENGNPGPSAVAVLLNTTPVGATAVSFAAQTFALGAAAYSVALADLNGDGKPDIVMTNYELGTVSVLLNTTPLGATAASFAAPQTFAVGAAPEHVVIGDLNGDGKPDIVVANYDRNMVSVLVNTTAAGASAVSFAALQSFAVSPAFDVALADVNGDGRPDLAVATTVGTVSVLMNTTPVGSTSASFAAEQIFTVSSQGTVIAGDFSGNGRPDLAIVNRGNAAVSILENATPIGAAAASFAAPQTFATGANPVSLAAGDFNFDGRTDLVVANSGGNSISVLLNNLPTTTYAVTDPVVVGDFPGYGVQQYNLTARTWVQLTPFDPTVLAANADGNVAGNFPGYGVQLYRPTLGWQQITPVAATVLDMDAQGDIVGNFPGYGVHVYRPTTGWVQITPFQAAQVALDGYGNVVATFAGYGVQEYFLATHSWQVITPFVPAVFAMNAYGPGQQVNGFAATSIAINTYGLILANFVGYGVQETYPTAPAWGLTMPAQGTQLGLDRYGHGFGEFPGYGVFMYMPLVGWTQIAATNAALLSVADWPFDLLSPY